MGWYIVIDARIRGHGLNEIPMRLLIVFFVSSLAQRLFHDSSGREPRGGQATYRGLGSGKNAALFETYSVSQSC